MFLNRRTGYRAIGTEHAAIARLRLQQYVAALAFIEPLAGVGGHGFGLDVAAVRAGQRGLQDGFGTHGSIVAGVGADRPATGVVAGVAAARHAGSITAGTGLGVGGAGKPPAAAVPYEFGRVSSRRKWASSAPQVLPWPAVQPQRWPATRNGALLEFRSSKSAGRTGGVAHGRKSVRGGGTGVAHGRAPEARSCLAGAGRCFLAGLPTSASARPGCSAAPELISSC